MIGQKNRLSAIKSLVKKGFPRFLLITGPSKGGKRMLAKEIAKQLSAPMIMCGIKVDEVREIISLAYKQSEPVVYVFPCIDDMSVNAKNALLKITEEPPRQAYFIITANDRRNVLNTLLSRSYELPMELYSYEDLVEYLISKDIKLTEENRQYVLSLARTPGDIDLLATMNLKEFKDFAELVLANIGVVNGANALKIGRRFAYKPEDTGYDIEMFLRAVIQLCFKQINGFSQKYYDTIKLCSEVITKLSINGIDKKTLMDMWILDMRSVWIDEV